MPIFATASASDGVVGTLSRFANSCRVSFTNAALGASCRREVGALRLLDLLRFVQLAAAGRAKRARRGLLAQIRILAHGMATLMDPRPPATRQPGSSQQAQLICLLCCLLRHDMGKCPVRNKF